MFSRSQVVRLCCYGYLAGVILASIFSFTTLAGLALLLLIYAIKYRRSKILLRITLLLATVLLGYFHLKISFPRADAGHMAFYNDSKQEWLGMVREEPDVRLDEQKLTLTATWRRESSAWQPVSGRVLVTTGLYPRQKYGDLLHITCQLKKPPSDGDFNYQNYLARYDIYSICFTRSLETVAEAGGSPVKRIILGWKEELLKRSARLVPEPENALLQGILLGAKKSIPSFLQEDLKKTGLSHIVALSGYNVTIVATVIYRIIEAFGLRRKMGFVITLVVLLVFIAATGGQSSIIRAALMGLGALFAEVVGRRARADHLLLLSATIMAAFNPKIVVFDIGFQLSCAATAGLLFLTPLIEPRLRIIPQVGGIRSSLASTLAAIVATTPFTTLYFGNFSLVAPLANIVVLPLIPMSMLLGALALLLDFIIPPLAVVTAWLTWLVLHIVVILVAFLSW